MFTHKVEHSDFMCGAECALAPRSPLALRIGVNFVAHVPEFDEFVVLRTN